MLTCEYACVLGSSFIDLLIAQDSIQFHDKKNWNVWTGKAGKSKDDFEYI